MKAKNLKYWCIVELSDELLCNLNLSLALVQLLVEFSCTVRHQLAVSGPEWESLDRNQSPL